MMEKDTRSAFTLVELLVVLGVIAILVGLLLPAIQQVRTTARTLGCLNNGRQIGLTAVAFHDIHGHLPTEPLLCSESPGWAIDLLPHLEQSSLWNQFDLNQPVDSDANVSAASGYRPSIFRCPQNQDSPLSVAPPSGVPVQVLPNHYVFNSTVFGVPMARIPQTDSTMLARDSGSFAQLWHSSPFTSVLNDGSPPVHPGGTVVVYVSGRAELRTNNEGLIVGIAAGR